MEVRLKFLGGAGSVTGSKYLLEVDDRRVLIDCGLFQGLKELRLRNWDPFPVETDTIDAVILTHAHIDHSGYLPRLYREGFSGQVYCTSATASLLGILLPDAGRLQQEEASWARKKGYSKHGSPQPLFTEADALHVLPQLAAFPYNETIQVTDRIQVSFHQAGHILGASSVMVTLTGEHQTKTILFSGDLGPYDNPLHFAPEEHKQTDVLLVESTYGNRSVKGIDVQTEFKKVILETAENNGCLVIPAFSVGRTQLLLYHLWNLFNEKQIPDWPVYIDSPMAISVTDLYRKYSDQHKLEDPSHGHFVFDHPNFKYVRHQSASIALNEQKRQAIIISASGMSTGGRILHHLFHRLPNKQDTILLSGYQAVGSRGRHMQEGHPFIKIFGEEVSVKAQIKTIDGLSAHADKDDLHQWLDAFEKAPKLTCIVHGEAPNAQALENYLVQEKKWNSLIPEYLESVQLFDGI